MFFSLRLVGAFARVRVSWQRNFFFTRVTVLAIIFLSLWILSTVSVKAENPSSPATESPLAGAVYVENQLIIKFAPGVQDSWKRELRSTSNSVILRELSLIGAELVQISGMTVEEAIGLYKDDTRIQYVEPNYVCHADIIPNDPYFNLLWGMHNTGQTGGTVDADIDAVEAWNISTGDSVIIGVIDTGVDTAHIDLLGNIWTNPGEIPNNGIDDDGNGYIDDIHGWDFVNWDNGPIDDNGHGTHCSGTIAAVGNNAIGVAGVCWSARIMALKFLDAWGYGYTSDAILAVEYATKMGANLTSNSWGGGSFSQALKDAIDSSGAHGMLFVAAAGNDQENNDIYPHYPCSYDLDNIISVAATDHNDNLANFSNWGLTSVDLGAPGVNIYSSIPGGSYQYMSGTSMATPHVSGAVALVWSEYPALTYLQVKNRIMNMVDPVPSLAGKCVSGGRLNVFMAMAEPESIPPSPISDLTVIKTEGSKITLSWTATGDDTSTGTASYYDVRYSLSLIDSNNFDLATQVIGEPEPKPAGSPETLVVRGLNFNTTYYFAIKAFDEWSNPSGVSNSPWGTTLGPPDISVSPDSLSDSLFTGETSTQVLTIFNTGVSDLYFDISIKYQTEAPLSLRLRPNSPEEGLTKMVINKPIALVKGRGEWLYRSESGVLLPVNEGSGGMAQSYPKAYRWQSEKPTAQMNILIYADDYIHTAPNTFLDQALQSLGLAYTAHYEGDWAGFEADLTSGTWDLVLFANDNWRPPTTTLIALNNYVNNGGKLVFHGWTVGSDPGNQLWTTLGFIWVSNDYDPPDPVYWWQPQDPIFNHPERVPEFTSLNGGIYGIYGQRVEPLAGFEALAGYTTPGPDPNMVAMIRGNNSRTLFKGFLDGQNSADLDGDTMLDGVELWINMIENITGMVWFSVNPESGIVPADSSIDVEVVFDATGLYGGDYQADIIIASNDPDEPEDTVKAYLHVTGAPDIATDSDSLNFGIVYIGYPESLPLLVSNQGTDILTVTGIVPDLAEFSVDLTNFVLAPGEDTVVNVSFAPTFVGEVWGNLTISSDDPDEPTLVVSLGGEGLVCPNVWVDPPSVLDSLFTGETSVETLTVGNSGGSPLYFKVELDNFVGPTTMKGVSSGRAVALYKGSSSISDLLGAKGERKIDYDPDAQTTAGLYEFGQDGFSNISANPGDVLASWPAPSPIQGPWGLGFDGNDVWVSDYMGITDNEVSTAGVLLSWFSCSGWVGVWPADMDWDGNYIWQVNVGGDNGIYKLDPANGNVLSSIHDPSHTWDAVSQRGLAYDRKTDVFYIGGWNQNRVYKIKGLSWNNPGEILSFFDFPNVSGLAWHPAGTLWIAVNASTDYIFQVNPETGSIISQFLAPGTGGGYEGAGLAIDKGGNLWCISQSTHMVYLVESGVPAYQWLTVTPEACTLGVGETKKLEVRFDATGLFGGNYSADIIIQSNDCEQSSLSVPALLHVTGVPNIVVDFDTLNFGIVYIGYPESLPLLISNQGTDILTVTGIVPNLAEFSVDLTNFALAPGKDTVVNVTFAPTFVGEVLGNLTISSDDPDESTYTVILTASGRQCPDIAFSPDSLLDSLYTGQTTVDTLYLKNEGADTLIFSFPAFGTAKLLSNPLIKKNDTENRFGYLEFGKDETDTRKGNPVALGAGGPDSTGYTWIDSDEPGGPVFNYIDISGTGTLVTGLTDDNYVGPFPIGFSFQFYDSSYTEFYIQSNGLINFDNTYIDYSNQPIPQVDPYNNLLAWCWDDLYVSTGNVYYQQMSNKLVIQYVGYGEFGGPGTVDAEVIIYSDGKILFQYDSFNNGFNVLGSTIGIENAYGTDGLQVAFNSAYLHDRLAILFSRRPQWITGVSPASGTVLSGDSLAIEVALSAANMFGGDYIDSLEISSNDCDNPFTFVPAMLHVTGAPDIVISEDALDYGNVFIGASVIDTFIVSNEGTDLLTVTDILSDDSCYTVTPTNFILNIGQSQNVLVTFTPNTPGAIPGTLTITSNDPDESALTVVLFGVGVVPPDIAISPDSLSDVLVNGESATSLLTIYNYGGSNLDYGIQVEEVGPSGNREPAFREYDSSYYGANSVKGENDFRVGSPIHFNSGGPDSFGYQWRDSDDPGGPEFAWEEISGIGTQITGLGDDDNVGPFNLGFPFSFYGNEFNSIYFCTNGWLSFTSTLTQFWNEPLPSQFAPENLVAPFWDDLNFYIGGSAYYYSDGNRFIVEYKGVYHIAGGGPYTFEVILYPNGRILYQYLSMGMPVDGSTVGIQNADKSMGLEIAFNTSYVHDSLATLIYKGVDWLEFSPISGTIPPLGSQTISATFEAPDTSGVDYFADLAIISNDPDEDTITVPVHMRVVAIGDVNADFKINLSDVIYLANYLLKGGPAPKSLLSADVFCDSHIDLIDVIWLANYLIKGWTICEPH